MVDWGFIDKIGIVLQSTLVKALLVLLLFIFLANLVSYILKRYIARLAKKTETPYDDYLVKKVELPISIIVVLVGVRIGAKIISLGSIVFNILETILLLFATYIVMLSVRTLIDIWAEKWKVRTKSEFEDEILPFLRSFVNIIIALISLMFILSSWNVQIGPLLASLGILGLAIGLALQSSLSNVFGGISLVLDKAFKSGDFVQLPDGIEGRIKSIGIRSTKIISLDNQLVIVPNKTLAESVVVNYAKPNNVLRIRVPVSVAYGTNVDVAEKVMLKSLRKFKDEFTKESRVRFLQMAEFSLDFEVLMYIADYHKRLDLASDVTREIYKNLRKSKIEIPFPTRTLYVKKK